MRRLHAASTLGVFTRSLHTRRLLAANFTRHLQAASIHSAYIRGIYIRHRSPCLLAPSAVQTSTFRWEEGGQSAFLFPTRFRFEFCKAIISSCILSLVAGYPGAVHDQDAVIRVFIQKNPGREGTRMLDQHKSSDGTQMKDFVQVKKGQAQIFEKVEAIEH